MRGVPNNTRGGKPRHVFFLVADPYASGIGLERTDPLKHPAHIVGQGVMAPVEESFRIAKESLPSLQTIGVAWNPVSYTHLRAHETVLDLVCRLLLEKKKNKHTRTNAQS